MIILSNYSFLIVLLALGFGAGYWILTTANVQERTLEIVGIILGWILIAMTLIIGILNSYSSMNMMTYSSIKSSCPINSVFKNHKMKTEQMEDKEDNQKDTKEDSDDKSKND